MRDTEEMVVVMVVSMIVIGIYIALVVFGVRMAKRKNRSPHWMWFALHPLGLLIVLIVLAAVKPLKVCPECAESVKGYARICPYCGASLTNVPTDTPAAERFPSVFAAAPPRGQNIVTSDGMSETQMVATLRQLCDAYSRNNNSEIARLEPIATDIGQRLDTRGGIDEMRRVWERLRNVPGSRTLDMHWDGIGEWRG